MSSNARLPPAASSVSTSTTVPKPHRFKFDNRASKCVLLGYLPRQIAYRLYDLHSHNIFISRNVQFHEDIFPFAQIPPSATSVPLPHIPLTTYIDEDAPSSVASTPSPPLVSQFSSLSPSRQWNKEFTRSLAAYGFQQSTHDH
ncbi:UNVERIFIED_CONTAM: hypothetical protein Sindi_0384500 [Sesamum indicum]